MQPYFMPYIGYFQLIHAVDKFIFYDDVHFIKGGWINRNNILLHGNKLLFSLPIQDMSSSKTIRESLISEKPFQWGKKLAETFRRAYCKAPYFEAVFPWVDEMLRSAVGRSVGDVAMESVEGVFRHIGLAKNFSNSFGRYDNNHLKGAERVIDICRREGGTDYVNAIGGQSLYERPYFDERGIGLHFLKSNLTPYPQSQSRPVDEGAPFMAGLSILDVLMNNDPIAVRGMLDDYTLI